MSLKDQFRTLYNHIHRVVIQSEDITIKSDGTIITPYDIIITPDDMKYFKLEDIFTIIYFMHFKGYHLRLDGFDNMIKFDEYKLCIRYDMGYIDKLVILCIMIYQLDSRSKILADVGQGYKIYYYNVNSRRFIDTAIHFEMLDLDIVQNIMKCLNIACDIPVITSPRDKVRQYLNMLGD